MEFGFKPVCDQVQAGLSCLKLVADRFKAIFHYTIWFEAGRRQVQSWLQNADLSQMC